MFSCEYHEIFKSTYFEEHLQTTASDLFKKLEKLKYLKTKAAAKVTSKYKMCFQIQDVSSNVAIFEKQEKLVRRISSSV